MFRKPHMEAFSGRVAIAQLIGNEATVPPLGNASPSFRTDFSRPYFLMVGGGPDEPPLYLRLVCATDKAESLGIPYALQTAGKSTNWSQPYLPVIGGQILAFGPR